MGPPSLSDPILETHALGLLELQQDVHVLGVVDNRAVPVRLGRLLGRSGVEHASHLAPILPLRHVDRAMEGLADQAEPLLIGIGASSERLAGGSGDADGGIGEALEPFFSSASVRPWQTPSR